MPDSAEAVFLGTLFDRARKAMQAASDRGPFPPRFVMEGARAMAKHVRMDEERMQESLPAAAFYQCFLPSALVADPSNFTEAASRLPESAAVVRRRLCELNPQPQLVIATFHMSCAPLILMLVNAALLSLRSGPRHVLIAPRNMGWSALDSGRWLREAVEVIAASPSGLRSLVAGLRNGSIQRLGTLVDGPHPPGKPGVRALSGLSPDLGFRTGVLRSVLSMGIPVLPLTHCWESDRLVLKFGPLLQSPSEGIDAIAGIIEGMLRSHPEQWLNWQAARLRT